MTSNSQSYDNLTFIISTDGNTPKLPPAKRPLDSREIRESIGVDGINRAKRAMRYSGARPKKSSLEGKTAILVPVESIADGFDDDVLQFTNDKAKYDLLTHLAYEKLNTQENLVMNLYQSKAKKPEVTVNSYVSDVARIPIEDNPVKRLSGIVDMVERVFSMKSNEYFVFQMAQFFKFWFLFQKLTKKHETRGKHRNLFPDDNLYVMYLRCVFYQDKYHRKKKPQAAEEDASNNLYQIDQTSQNSAPVKVQVPGCKVSYKVSFNYIKGVVTLEKAGECEEHSHDLDTLLSNKPSLALRDYVYLKYEVEKKPIKEIEDSLNEMFKISDNTADSLTDQVNSSNTNDPLMLTMNAELENQVNNTQNSEDQELRRLGKFLGIQGVTKSLFHNIKREKKSN